MPATADLERRCTRLEEDLAFQDAAVAELNTALAAQQKQLDDMDHRMRALEQRFRDLWNQSQQDIAVTTPPHYGQVR